jgi:serine/threonine-protein kinase
MNLETGAQLGDYRLISRIGKGSYGVVYEAEHAITKRIDALKLMLYAGPCAADDEQRFLREIQVQASLQHPNIAAVYTAFRTEWGPALVMELVRGESLRAVLDRRQLPLQEGVAYIQAALRGLSAAERLHVVHRDIKPENILITQDGLVKLTDFGLAHVVNGARLTGSGENIGTPCYMSPEQVIGTEPVDGRSDIYSAGVVLYEVATGRPPFLGTNGFAVMLAQRNTPPVPPIELNPNIGARLNRAILTALEKDPARRFRTAADFSAALDEAVVQLSTQPVVIPLPPTRRSRLRTGAMTVAAAGVGCLAMVGLGHLAAGHYAVSPAPVEKAAPAPAPAPIQAPQPTPIPPAAEPAAVVEPPPAVVAAAPEPAAPVRTERRRTVARPQAQAPTTALRITAAEESERPPAPAPMALAEKSEPAAPTAVQTPPAAPPPAQAPASAPAAAVPASDPPADADKSVDQAKHHNAVVRALGKIFKKKPATTPPDK